MASNQERSRMNMIEAIKRLNEEGIPFVQKSSHHLKLGNLNFWPSTGTITQDGKPGSAKRELAGLIEIIRGSMSKSASQPKLYVVPSASKDTVEKHQPVRRPQQQFAEGIKIGSGEILATPEALAARNKKREE